MLDWGLDGSDVEAALASAVTVEEYEEGSRLILGRSGLRPLHLVVREEDAGGVLSVITVYEPDEQRSDPSLRRRRRP